MTSVTALAVSSAEPTDMERARSAVDRIEAQLRTAPPPGVTGAEIEVYMEQHRDQLIAQHLEAISARRLAPTFSDLLHGVSPGNPAASVAALKKAKQWKTLEALHAASVAAAAHLDLTAYDVVLVSSSAGKDSQAMMDDLVTLATRLHIKDRLVVVHADLRNSEWHGTGELAKEQARRYGLRFVVVWRTGETLLDYVRARGKWPDRDNRYCTSDFKRGPIRVVLTRLADEVVATAKGTRSLPLRKSRAAFVAEDGPLAGTSLPPERLAEIRSGAPVRLLNCIGLRGDESTKRKIDLRWVREDKISSGVRVVDTWLPIQDLSAEQVWKRIRASGVPSHPAYNYVGRLSCVFCVFAPREALLMAGKHNRGLLRDYVAVERLIRHTFKQGLKLEDLEAQLEAGYEPRATLSDSGWEL